jgi:hypothetical protein
MSVDPPMNFMQLLQSLDELLYEVMSWLVFFPITLWRTITHPLRMMAYADSELEDQPADQYQDTLTPPLFLLLSLLLSHVLEMALSGQVNPIVASQSGLAAYIDTDTKLLVLRLILFSMIPLALAASSLRGRRLAITRDSLRAPFYAQCYPAGTFALAIGIGTLLAHGHSGSVAIAGAILLAAAIAMYFAVQIAWFHHTMRRGRLAAAAYAAASIFGGVILALLLALLFA